MLNEQKITYRMKNLIESGFFGRNKSLLTEAFADRDKVRIFQAAYNYTYDKNISVDGIKGTQTNAAIEAVKKDLGKDKLDDAAIKDFYTKFLTKLDENAANINVGEGGSNNNRNLNLAIQALINLAGQPIVIDGVIGTKTITAIKTVTNDGSGIINKDTVTGITGKAVQTNVQGGLGVEGIATVQGKTREQITAESRKEWEKYPCVTQAEGVKEEILPDGTIRYTDKDNAYIYFGNGRRMRKSDSVKEDYYCNGMTVVVGVMQKSNTNPETEGNCVEGNCVNGQGKFVRPNKDEYIGTFVNGKLTGKNNKIIYHSTNSMFTGETQDNKKVSGEYIFANSGKYEGFFLNEKLHGNSSIYTSPTGKKWRGNFRDGAPVGTTWGQLNNPLLADDGEVTVFPTPGMQASAKDLKLKEAFNNDMKKLVEIIKDYRNQRGFYKIKSANDFRFYDNFEKEIFRTTNVFKELANIPSGRFWMYKPDTKTIFFYEADKNYYVHRIT